MKTERILAACVLTFGLTACAQPARIDAMTVAQMIQPAAAAPLSNSIAVQSVSGGTKTNPLWTSEVGDPEFEGALTASLKANGLYAAAGKYGLQAKLLELKQPLIGLDMTVTSRVLYTLTDSSTKATVFSKQIDAEFTATMGDAIVAVQRLRLANEGSIRKNITLFLNELVANSGKPVAGNVSLTGPAS